MSSEKSWKLAACLYLPDLTTLAASATLVMMAPLASRAEEAFIGNSEEIEGIVVTATRREENLRQVPISIGAYNEAQLQERGIKQIDDLARYTPGLEFVRTGGVSGNTSNNISIRGISSDVGSATTAIYIDDTPIQVRNIGYFAANPYPQIFDLDRIEVLKGPQGTLFGASAEGGAVRFITRQPNLNTYSGNVRTELATTQNGDTSYEVGAAFGGPVAQDVLGLRVSGWTRRDGGYIDRVDPTTGETTDENVNSQRHSVFRGALGWQPMDGLTVTPSFLYQRTDAADREQYWENLSSDQNYKTGNLLREPSRDEFYLPALKMQLDTQAVSFVSNTSFFDRKQNIFLDYTNFLRALYTGDPMFALPGTIPSGARVTTKQNTFTQEFRAQSVKGTWIDWTAGIFYSHAKQEQLDLTDSSSEGGTAVNGYSYIDDVHSTDEQISGYASLDFHLTAALKLIAGARVSHTRFSYTDTADGPVNGGFTHAEGATSETPVTPKIGIAYSPDANNLFYANASKGFRPGGAQAKVPSDFCADDLATLGLSSSPTEYGSDNVNSFDIGSKNRIFNGVLNLDASAYYTKWDDIQQAVRLPTCSFAYTTNLGKATSRGVDLSIEARIVRSLRIGIVVGYNDTTFDGDVFGGAGVLLAADGDRIGGPKVTGSAWSEVDFHLPGGHASYVRADLTYRSKGIEQNPATFSYDPGLSQLDSTSNLSLRGGAQAGAYDISVFVNNLLNEDKPSFRAHDIPGSTLYYAGSYRPRTVGVTVSYGF